MTWQLIALLAGIALTALVAAFTAGEWHGERKAVNGLWDSAMALGAYGQMTRMQAEIEGITVAELLERERNAE